MTLQVEVVLTVDESVRVIDGRVAGVGEGPLPPPLLVDPPPQLQHISFDLKLSSSYFPHHVVPTL